MDEGSETADIAKKVGDDRVDEGRSMSGSSSEELQDSLDDDEDERGVRDSGVGSSSERNAAVSGQYVR